MRAFQLQAGDHLLEFFRMIADGLLRTVELDEIVAQLRRHDNRGQHPIVLAIDGLVRSDRTERTS